MRRLLINAAEPDEVRVALVEDGRLEEYRRERSAGETLVGNVYHGVVVNLEPGIGAAFVDIGVGRNAFLHVSACAGAGPDDARRIDELFTLGDRALVQVTRESIGGKGPVLTGEISLPGRFLFLLPLSAAGGVSRRIAEDSGRARMRTLVKGLEKEWGAGLIVRTAGADRSREELVRDLTTLRRVWDSIRAKQGRGHAPALLYREGDLVARALRDLVDREVTEISVDTPEARARATETVAAIQPELADRLRLYEGAMPLFHAHGVEAQIDELRQRRVALPGGGSVVFDRTEALVAIDVNSGRMREEEGLEETALKTDLEAADVIARQVRLRDLGGVIVVDFIDLKEADHVRAVEQAFREALARDRARVRTGRMGAFGLFAFTRRRVGPGGVESRRPCPRCGGSGEVVDPDEVALRLFRELRARAADGGAGGLRARAGPEVADALESGRGALLGALRADTGRAIRVEADAGLPPDGWAVETV